jgi:hypothetical protein
MVFFAPIPIGSICGLSKIPAIILFISQEMHLSLLAGKISIAARGRRRGIILFNSGRAYSSLWSRCVAA